jgi:hypothetical protein
MNPDPYVIQIKIVHPIIKYIFLFQPKNRILNSKIKDNNSNINFLARRKYIYLSIEKGYGIICTLLLQYVILIAHI